jgi:hypothetical protein
MKLPIVLEDAAGRHVGMDVEPTITRVNVIVGKIGAIVFVDSGARTPLDGFRVFRQSATAVMHPVNGGVLHAPK